MYLLQEAILCGNQHIHSSWAYWKGGWEPWQLQIVVRAKRAHSLSVIFPEQDQCSQVTTIAVLMNLVPESLLMTIVVFSKTCDTEVLSWCCYPQMQLMFSSPLIIIPVTSKCVKCTRGGDLVPISSNQGIECVTMTLWEKKFNTC